MRLTGYTLCIALIMGMATASRALTVSELTVNGVSYSEADSSGTGSTATTLISAPYQNGYYWVTVAGRVSGSLADLTTAQTAGLVIVKSKYGSFEYNRRLTAMLEGGIAPLMLGLDSAPSCRTASVAITNWYDDGQVSAALQATTPSTCFPLFSLGDKFAQTGYADNYWYRGISVKLLPDSAGRFAYAVPVPAATAAKPFAITLQAATDVLGTADGGPGLTTAVSFSTVKTLYLKGLSNAVAAPTYSAAVSGTPYAYNLIGSIDLGGNDLGVANEVYAAILMGGRLFFHNGTDWVVYVSGAYPTYAAGATTSPQTLNLFSGYDLSRLSVAGEVYVGYGRSAADMLARGTYQWVTTLQPAPTKPQIVTLAPTSVVLKTATEKPTVLFSLTGVSLEALGTLTFQLDGCSSPAGNVIAAGNSGFSCTFDGSTGSKVGKIYQALTNKPDNPFSTTTTDVAEPIFTFNVTVSAPAGTTGTGTTTPAAVTAVTPLTASPNVPTTFTVTGTNLKSASAILASVEGCTQTVAVASDTQGTFICTLGSGVRAGSVSTVSSAGVSTKVFDFTVTVQSSTGTGTTSPSVASVSPLIASTGEITTYTLRGQNLKSFGGSLRFNVTDCAANVVNVASDTTATVSCAHITGGLKSGTVDAVLTGGVQPLKFVEISVISR